MLAAAIRSVSARRPAPIAPPLHSARGIALRVYAAGNRRQSIGHSRTSHSCTAFGGAPMKRWGLMAALLLCGCTSAAAAPMVTAHIISRVIPTPYAPRRDDAIALVVPDPASTDDQALMALLASELPRNGFHTVDAPEDARWVLQARYVLLSQATTGDAATPDAETPLLEERQADIRLMLYSVNEFIDGERSAIWTSTAYGQPELYAQHPRTLLRLLLQHFGSDYAGALRSADLDRGDSHTSPKPQD